MFFGNGARITAIMSLQRGIISRTSNMHIGIQAITLPSLDIILSRCEVRIGISIMVFILECAIA